jgi:hypothetical protein
MNDAGCASAFASDIHHRGGRPVATEDTPGQRSHRAGECAVDAEGEVVAAVAPNTNDGRPLRAAPRDVRLLFFPRSNEARLGQLADIRELERMLRKARSTPRSPTSILPTTSPCCRSPTRRVTRRRSRSSPTKASTSRRRRRRTRIRSSRAGILPPIDPGSSGGPLTTPEGRLLGVNTLKARRRENVGLAIPAAAVAEAVKGAAAATQGAGDPAPHGSARDACDALLAELSREPREPGAPDNLGAVERSISGGMVARDGFASLDDLPRGDEDPTPSFQVTTRSGKRRWTFRWEQQRWKLVDGSLVLANPRPGFFKKTPVRTQRTHTLTRSGRPHSNRARSSREACRRPPFFWQTGAVAAHRRPMPVGAPMRNWERIANP